MLQSPTRLVKFASLLDEFPGRLMTKLTSPSKLAFTYGALTFSAEGDADWCEKQLHAVLNATSVNADAAPQYPDISDFTPSFEDDDAPAPPPHPRRATKGPSDFSLTLTNYLKARTGASNRRLNRTDGGGGRMPASVD
jgi:hypothetical protein